MAAQKWVLSDVEQGIFEAGFAKEHSAGGKTCSIKRKMLRGGVSEGVDTIEVDNGKFRFVVVPTRGMGLWKGWLGGQEIGWKSPVHGPVHPQFVPLNDPNGLGWLEGFDELMCRCGLESNGAPDIDEKGICKYPLHGRIANRPAHRVEASIDDATGEITVRGLVDEVRFHFQKLRLAAGYKTKVGQNGLTIFDEVTNLSGSPAELQLVYHINFGQPLLDPGSKVVLPVKTMVPRDPRAAEGVSSWDHFANEEPGYAEQVYFFELAADAKGQTEVLLKNAHSNAGVTLRFNKQQLPYFTLWKNTPTGADGYVTGLEPGTNFPNPRSFETAQKRVVKLAPGETKKFEVELALHPDAAGVSAAEQAVAKLQAGTKPQIHTTPQAAWTRV